MTEIVMIHVKPQFISTDEFHRWCEKAREARAELLESRTNNKKYDFKKAETIWTEFKKAFLFATFHNKCAYCEHRLEPAETQIDHFRPKGRAKDENGAIANYGYYWLAFEWYNLLPACGACNGGSGKADHFPIEIEGDRVQAPSGTPDNWIAELNREAPLLLNPYEDEPEQHMCFDDRGFVIDKTKRGKMTREICKLDRSTLIERRNEAKRHVKEILAALVDNSNNIEADNSWEFALWKQWLLKRAKEKIKLD